MAFQQSQKFVLPLPWMILLSLLSKFAQNLIETNFWHDFIYYFNFLLNEEKELPKSCTDEIKNKYKVYKSIEFVIEMLILGAPINIRILNLTMKSYMCLFGPLLKKDGVLFMIQITLLGSQKYQ